MENIFREYKTDAEFEMRPRLDFPAHVHDSVELVYVCRGGGNAFVGGRRYVLTEGSFFVAFPNQVHSYEGCVPGEYIVLILNPSGIPSLEQVLTENEPENALCHPTDNRLPDLLKEALEEKCVHGQGRVLDGYFNLLFARLVREMPLTKNNTHSDSSAKVLRYCAEHFKENITIADLSDALHLSPSSLSHIFSSRLKINFCRYINALRISYALRLMEDRSRTITEIAYMAGFSTIRTFNRAFLAEHGVSPSQYIKNQKSRF